ncbi:MAG: RagB/SusD family nutrient uptake outer membrane protein, partial [Bacteroidales bacterium]|nr:RagB/SusD family nutrient uptake outer membrane protein [Bacteroidales bacterium]
MKAKNIILALAATTVALSSCNDLLNISQHGVQNYETYYQTDEEAEAAIVACYSIALGNSYNALMGKNMLTDDFWAGGAMR